MRDNGIGIDPQIRKRIFEVFQHLNQRDGHGGSGIGLAISRSIVERHGGRLSVESERGIGSVFRFDIPYQS